MPASFPGKFHEKELEYEKVSYSIGSIGSSGCRSWLHVRTGSAEA